jgi:hypothetical protein
MTEPTKPSIFAALAKAQSEMGKAQKITPNPHFKSKYADLSGVMDACMFALNANGIAVYQPMREADGTRYVVTILAHASGEIIECAVPLIVQKNDMQGLGSAITYARRYGLMSMAGIAPEDDDGNAAAAAAPKHEAAKPAPRRADPAPEQTGPTEADIAQAVQYLDDAETRDDLTARWKNLPTAVRSHPEVVGKSKARAAAIDGVKAAPIITDDKIPY